MTEARRRTGALAERLAAALLVRHGCRVLARNIVAGRSEIDLLVDVGGEVAAVEVRSVVAERGLTTADPVAAFGIDKARRVRAAAARLRPPVSRIDLVAVRFHASGVDLHWVPRAG
ncbi:MAG: YraN family protein [Acidimicrobiia bacterium]